MHIRVSKLNEYITCTMTQIFTNGIKPNGQILGPLT